MQKDGERPGEQWKTVGGSRKRPVQQSGDHLASPPSKEAGKDDCNICDFRAKSKHELNSHMIKHNENDPEHYCKVCQEEFPTDFDFERHIKEKHSKQWNCNNCDFQSSTRVSLMNHCKGVTLTNYYF